MNTLGDNIKKQRAINGLSQKDLATKLNTTQQRVSEWECGKVEPSLYNIVKILEVFNISFEEFVEGIKFE